MFDEFRVLRDQDFLDQIRMTEQQDLAMSEAQRDHVAIRSGTVR